MTGRSDYINYHEFLTGGGDDIKLKIVSATRDMGEAPEMSATVYEEGESDFPVDIEDAALRYLQSEEAESREQKVEQVTVGKYSEKDGRVTITYDESELLGMPETLTHITFSKNEPNVVAIVRSGAMTSTFVLEKGRHHICEYNMGFASIPLCFYAREVKNTVENGKGTLQLNYLIEINGAVSQSVKLNITVGF